MDITKVDTNFAVKHLPEGVELDFYPASMDVFDLRGIFLDERGYTRMPTEVARSVSESVVFLHRNTAGGRLRFYTDSPTVTVAAVSDYVSNMAHFTHVGANGFDLYLDGKPQGCFYAAWSKEGDLNYLLATKVLSYPGEVEIYFPLYANVTDLKIGLEKGSKLLPTSVEYSVEKPVVFYGSSVTQGGCATRAGMSYESILCRELMLDHVNLGFSGSAKGEAEMAQYIASLDMSMLVFDYDYNAWSPEHLSETHKPFFDTVRASHPDIPIVMLSAPMCDGGHDFALRKRIVRGTYEAALANGDEKVYFIGGDELLSSVGNEGLVDKCHPTDLGFWSMAMGLCPIVKTALGLDDKK